MCGSPIPSDQGSSTCSMCYGDPEHGKDNYYNDWIQKQSDQLTEENGSLLNELAHESFH